MQIYRFDPLTHLVENPEPVFRDDRLRELVDGLPEQQCHLVSRVFFGGAALKAAAAEIDVTTSVARKLLETGLGALRDALQETD